MKTMLTTFLVLILSSLLSLTPGYASNSHPLTGEKLAENQVFYYRIGAESPSIDPQLVEDVEGSAISRDLFEGLLTQNADGTLAPGVAERWEGNAKKDSYTFYLRKNARWSNGDPVTSHDFVYAWRRAVDPVVSSPYASFMELTSIKNVSDILKGKKPTSELGIEAVDDYTLKVSLSGSLSYFPSMMVHTTTFPTHQKTIEKHGNSWTKPGNMVSNGAYKLTEHVLNERLVRERNPMYWNNDKTIIDKTVGLIITDENQAYNRYQASELYKTEVPTGQFKRLKKLLPVETHSNPRLCSYYYIFNMEDETLKNLNLRKALTLAINRNIVTDKIMGAGQIPAYSFTPGSTANFIVPDTEYGKMTQKERNKQAMSLLAKEGYSRSNPLEITLLYNTSEGHKKVAIAVRQMWKQVGIKATLENQEWKTFLSTRDAGNFQIARSGWCGDYNEASTFLDLLRSDSDQNDSNYNNPVVDDLIVSARTMDDPNPNYKKVEELIAKDFPISPIYHYTGVLMLKPYVKGWPHQNVEANWYSKDLYITAH
jgi:oligopeptide transport system substrate-binding protein